MYVRLGFAVAVNVNPDILVVDEVLAVGDERFQRKCIERVKDFQREGRTILLVTHSPDQVRSICDRAVVLSHGDVVNEGPPGEAVRIFREGLLEEEGTLSIPDESPEARHPIVVPKGTPDVEHPVRVTYVAHTYPRFEEVGYLATGESLTIGVGYHASIATDDVVFSLELRDADDNCFMRTDTDIMGLRFDLPIGPGLVNFLVDDIPLLDGTFSYSVGILSKGGVLFDWREPAGTFSVMCPGKATGFITLPVRAWLLPPEPEAIAQMAPEELDYLRPGA
jgi:ABC-2 type transport system ATP-binding protein